MLKEKKLKMIFSRRIRELRKEKNWSQEELAKKIGSDARQISRYENGKITPSIDAIIKLAEVFDISVDYILFEAAMKRPLKTTCSEVAKRLQHLECLNKSDQDSLLNVLDALIARNKVKSLADDL